MDEAHEIGLAIDGDGERGRMWEARIRTYGEACRRAGARAMRETLEEIKSLVVGDKHPRWVDDWATTTTRRSIADIVDEVLSSLPSVAEAASPAAGWRRMGANDLHYLRSILGTLREVRAGPSLLGREVLADNIDWLDCFIELQEQPSPPTTERDARGG